MRPGLAVATHLTVSHALAVLSLFAWSGMHWRFATSLDWIGQLIRLVRRWQPTQALVLVVDGGLAAVKLGLKCLQSGHPVTYVSRLRFDAALYDPPAPQPTGKRGPKPKKGKRQPAVNPHVN